MNEEQWFLSKYAKWEDGEWKVISSQSNNELVLCLKDIQLSVFHGDTCLESFSIAQSGKNIKGMYNNGTFAIAMRFQEKGSKFKMLFLSELDGEKCVVKLRRYFKIVIAEGSRPVVDVSVDPISERMISVLNKSPQNFPCPESIPEEYPLEEAVKLCVIDSGFPGLVKRVNSIITNRSTSTPPNDPNTYLK